jgi:hypothetical protein
MPTPKSGATAAICLRCCPCLSWGAMAISLSPISPARRRVCGELQSDAWPAPVGLHGHFAACRSSPGLWAPGVVSPTGEPGAAQGRGRRVCGRAENQSALATLVCVPRLCPCGGRGNASQAGEVPAVGTTLIPEYHGLDCLRKQGPQEGCEKEAMCVYPRMTKTLTGNWRHASGQGAERCVPTRPVAPAGSSHNEHSALYRARLVTCGQSGNWTGWAGRSMTTHAPGIAQLCPRTVCQPLSESSMALTCSRRWQCVYA